MSKLVIGERAPSFWLEDLDGRPVGLEDYQGQVTLINYWSAECPHVARVDALLAGWQDRIALLCIASNANEPPDMLRQAGEARGLRRVLRDPDQRVADLYGAEITPHLFLLDGAGVLRYQGAFDDTSFRRREPTRQYFREAVEALLGGRPVALSETQPYGCTIVRKFME